MAKFETRKGTSRGKTETLRRREIRRVKQSNAHAR